ncbi:MAG: hypothetical protein ABSB22_00135 [Thermodesulfobacteriota bacterium]
MRRNKARVSGEAFTPFLLVERLHGRNVWCSIHDAGYFGNDSLEWMER